MIIEHCTLQSAECETNLKHKEQVFTIDKNAAFIQHCIICDPQHHFNL